MPNDFLDRRQLFALSGTSGILASASASHAAASPAGELLALSQMGAHARTFADETSIVQDAIDLAIENRRPLLIDVATRVSALQVRGANGLVVIQTAPIVGLTKGDYPSLLSIVDSTDISWAGRLWLSCQWNSGYESAMHVLAETGSITSNITVQDWSITGARTAFRFGTPAPSDRAISEITIMGGSSYGCPNIVEAYGAETLVSFIGGNLVANHLGGQEGWSQIESDTVRIFGAYVSVSGGEVQHNASPDGSAFLMRPYVTPTGQARFGSLVAMGVAIEAAGPLFTASDLTGADIAPESGHFFIEGCQGYHSQRAIPFISIGKQYDGQVKIGSGCYFRAGAQRTAPIVRSAGGARIDVPRAAFNRLFHPEGGRK